MKHAARRISQEGATLEDEDIGGEGLAVLITRTVRAEKDRLPHLAVPAIIHGP